ncbi:MAG: hypothetical protein J6J31_06170, partial [Thermoguttaceae bacterium]|nr:hypothetical protein [Thermoguttaceae bacterium]
MAFVNGRFALRSQHKIKTYTNYTPARRFFIENLKIFKNSFKIIMQNVLFGTVETKITQKHGIRKPQ